MPTLTALPPALNAGDSLDIEMSEPLYSAADGWAIVHELRGASDITITSTGSGTTHTVALASAATEDWAPGAYWYARLAVNAAASKRVTLGTGQLTIRPNLAAITGAYDGRTTAQQILEAIDARLLNRATTDQNKYTIAGRSIDRIPVAELISLRDKFAAIVRNEREAETLASGGRVNRNIYVRLGGK